MKNEERRMKNCHNRTNSLLNTKSYSFALRIVQMTKQILRSGTSIGASIRESEFAQSNADFINKLSISLKEANETDYWLNLLKDSDYIDSNAFNSMEIDCGELIALLVSSIKTAKNNQMNHEVT